MARQKQDGLRYFSFDTDFFYADKRIKRLRTHYGSDGLIFYIYLLTEIYRNGYYLRWDEDSVEDAMDYLNLTEGLIEQIMTFLVSRSLLTEISILAGSDTIITSPGIQKRYQEAVKSLKRDVFVDCEIWLLSEEETASFIKFTHNEPKSRKNNDKSLINDNKSQIYDTKEIKRKEIKDNTIVVAPAKQDADDKYNPSEFDIKCVDYLIQSILNDLPHQRVPKTAAEKKKWAVHIERMQRLDGVDQVKIWDTLVWTMHDDFWRTNIRSTGKFREKFQTLYLQSQRTGQGSRRNAFNDFKQNQYDFDRLEQELMSN